MQKVQIIGGALLLLVGLLGLVACDHGFEFQEPPPADTAWRLVNPRPFDVQITDMWGTSPGRIMAVGQHGAVITREGDKWREAPRPTESDFFSIHGCDWQHIWAISREGLFFFDGSRWTLRVAGEYEQEDRVFCRAPNDVMVVTGDYESSHFDGTTWHRQDMPIRPYSRTGNWLLGWHGGYTVVGDRGNSATWRDGVWGPVEVVDEETHLTHLILDKDSLTLPNKEIPIALGTRNDAPNILYEFRRYLPDDWHAGWNRPLDGQLLDVVQGGMEGHVFYVTRTTYPDTVHIQKYSDRIPFPGLDSASLCVFDNPFDRGDQTPQFVLAGPQGSFYAGTAEAGIEQSVGEFVFEADWMHVWPNGDFTCVANRTELLHGRGGQTTLERAVLPDDIRAIWGPSPDTIYGVGYLGSIVRFSPGSPPTPMVSPTTSFLTSIWGSGPNDIWAGGFEVFLHFDGTDWLEIPTPEFFECRRIVGVASGGVFVLSQGSLLHWDGDNWTTAIDRTTSTVNLVAAPPAGNTLFALSFQHLPDGTVNYLQRLRDGQWETFVDVPPGPRALVALDDESAMVAASEGCFIWRDGIWTLVPHPSIESRQSNVYKVFGNQAGGIYSINSQHGIHYLDLGGTGLWQ